MSAFARPALLVGLCLAAGTLELAAQHGGMLPGSGPGDSTARGFAAAVRAATARYRDPQAASADGYRPIGPNFPGMGEHWLNAALLVAGHIDQSHPQILEYASIDGRLTLIGVAYAALTGSDTVPGTLPVTHAAWHFHSGTVDEESFIRGHADMAPGGGDSPRIAVLPTLRGARLARSASHAPGSGDGALACDAGRRVLRSRIPCGSRSRFRGHVVGANRPRPPPRARTGVGIPCSPGYHNRSGHCGACDALAQPLGGH